MTSRFQISYDLDPPPQHVVDAGLHLAARYETLATLGGYGQSIRAVDLPDGWMAYIVNLPHAKTIHFVGENAELAARRQDEEYVRPRTTVIPILYHYTGIATDLTLTSVSDTLIIEQAGYKNSASHEDRLTLNPAKTFIVDNTKLISFPYSVYVADGVAEVACFKVGVPVDVSMQISSNDSSKFQGYRCDPRRYTGMMPLVIQLLLGVGKILPSEVDGEKTDVEYRKDTKMAGFTDEDLRSYGSIALDKSLHTNLRLSLKYDYRWGRTHGIVWARRIPQANAPFIQSSMPERLWEPFLCEIGTRGILLMPLPRDGASFDDSVQETYLSLNPTLRRVIPNNYMQYGFMTDEYSGDVLAAFTSFMEMYCDAVSGLSYGDLTDIFSLFGGFPTDECFPQDAVELERLINSGVVMRFSHPVLDWFYSNNAVSTDHGWAFSKYSSKIHPLFPHNSSKATTVCYETDANGFVTYSHSVIIEIDIVQNPRQYCSLAEAVISALNLTKFTDIYKATLLTDYQAMSILSSGSYEEFMAASCEPEWSVDIDVYIANTGVLCIPKNVWDNADPQYYSQLENHPYFNQPVFTGENGKDKRDVTYTFFNYKYWDSILDKYFLLDPYNPNYANVDPLDNQPGFSLAPYKSFFLFDRFVDYGLGRYYDFRNFSDTGYSLGVVYEFEFSTIDFTYNFVLMTKQDDTITGRFLNSRGFFDAGILSSTISYNNYGVYPDKRLSMLYNYISEQRNAYIGSARNNARCTLIAGLCRVVALDYKNSRNGVFVFRARVDSSWLDYVPYSLYCKIINATHYEIALAGSYFIEDAMYHLLFCAYNERGWSDIGEFNYSPANMFYATKSIWWDFVDYLNPMRMPEPPEYFRLFCGGNEELYIKSNLPKKVNNALMIYSPEFYYAYIFQGGNFMQLANLITSKQVPISSIPFGCFPRGV